MSEKLLNTAEAARMLRVSQASVRRWSDAGLLNARRVGRRRERRFTLEDLENFLKPGAPATTRREDAVSRSVFVGGTHVPVHSHISTFYDSDDGRLRLTLPFLRDGLRLGQPSFLVADGQVLDSYLEALSQDGVDVDAAIRDDRFTTAPGPGRSVEGALHWWEQLLSRALASGPTLLRVVGEMSSARVGFESDTAMLDFEVAFNPLVKRLPTIALCQYDVREFDGQTIFRAIRAHPDVYELGLASFLN